MFIKRISYFRNIIFIIFISTSIFGSEDKWTNVGPTGGIVWTIKCYESDPSLLLIGTNGGGLYKSIDNGNNWYLRGTNIFYYGAGKLITDIEIRNNNIYICSTSGLYKSSDLGDNWETLFFSISGILTAVAVHPENPEIIYISYAYARAPMFKPAVSRSTDGGQNWVNINEGLTSLDVYDMQMSYENPDVLFIATEKGIFKTTDGGISGWQNISGNLPELPTYSITLDKTEPNSIYIGTRNGIFKTVNSDTNWLNITGSNFKNKSIRQHAISLINNIIFVGTENGLYKSIDGGKTWDEKIDGLMNSCIFSITSIDEQNILSGTADGFYKSTDGGESWKKQNNGLYAFNNTTLAIDPTVKPSQIFVGTNGAGIYKSDNYGKDWYDIQMDSGFIRVDPLAISDDNPQIMYAGYIGLYDSNRDAVESGIIKTENSGKIWYKATKDLDNLFIRSIVIDPDDQNILYVGTSDGIYKSSDGGLSWIKRAQGIDVDFIHCLAIDPQNSDIIYAGTEYKSVDSKYGVYKTINGGIKWEYISRGLPVENKMDVVDLCINPSNPNTIYAAIEWRGVYKSVNGGIFWSEINSGIDNKFIKSIAINPIDTNIVYIAGGKIYMSENAGNSWQEMMNGLPEYYGFINQIRVDPNDERRIYAATDGYGVLTYLNTTTSVKQNHNNIISHHSLFQNYPNPFNSVTEIKYRIAKPCNVVITIFNVQGQLVRTLVNDYKSTGNYSISWDAMNERGAKISSGIYLYELKAGDFIAVKKMALTE